ncbi:MAG: hypothetical protein ACI83B_002476 [Sediminicola sp.]|jgi:hypothetical protein
METELEYLLTHSHKAEMISVMNAHPEYYDEAIDLAVANKQPYSWRAAWLLWSIIDENDSRILKHILKILHNIKNKSNVHQRELIKILLEMHLDEEQNGYLYDLCVSIWKQVEKKPSVRFTAFRGVLKIAHTYPDLTNELLLLTQEKYMESLSPGVKKSILKMVRKI